MTLLAKWKTKNVWQSKNEETVGLRVGVSLSSYGSVLSKTSLFLYIIIIIIIITIEFLSGVMLILNTEKFL